MKEATMFCPRCGLGQPTDHRFCAGCGAVLPTHLLPPGARKVSQWFLGIPVVAEDPPNGALRVSRYLEEIEVSAPEGSVRVPAHHVRFSIWHGDRAVAAVSIPEHEAEELARFIEAPIPDAGDRRDTPVV
jgi:hypothetical protein